jgi:tetratricopeptide (TPR) repeat protein
MRRALCVLHCLVALSPPAFAQTLDKAKIRQAIEMPALSTSLGVRFKSRERDGKGTKFEPAEKIAELQRKLTGGPDDAFVYLEQHALCLECLKDEKKARELAVKAEATLRPHMQTADPKQGYLLTHYGMVLETLSDNPWNDCEKWARRAVSVAPQDWRTWTYLAHTRHQQIPFILVGGNAKQLSKDHRTQEVLGALHLRRLRPEHVEQAEKVLNEALQYHDKAKELAPNDAKRQEKRYGFRLTEIILRNGICAYRGEKPAYPMMQLERTLLDELQAAAQLQPDHLLWQSQLAHQLILLGWQTGKDQDGKPSKTFRPARPEDAQAIREALGHVEMLANQGQGETAVYCHSMLAAICSSMQDNTGAEKHSRKILELDPKNQQAAEQLQQALLLQGRSADQMRAAQTLAQTNPSSRNCFLLAKALVLNQQYDLAEKACLAGIEKDASDVHCLLGMAVLMMRKADDAQSLQVAREQLDRARRECRPELGNLFVEVEYLAAIHQALSGDALLARLKLQRLQIDHPDSPRYEKALSAIGR